jgi:Rrf2 family transcriptional regulator, iron-sulfur cluster assembly transcription factor
MIHQSKATQHAVAAVSRLAEVHHDPAAWLSAADIAASRNLRPPVAAKVLSTLAQNGIVVGSPGPGGGYRLARPPQEVSLWDVVHLFEGDTEIGCPYGPGWCGGDNPCPLHDSLMAMQSAVQSYLKATRFDAFARRSRPAKSATAARRVKNLRSRRTSRSLA